MATFQKIKWENKTLSQLGSIGRGKSKHRPRNAPILYGGKYPFVQTSDIKHANFYLNSYSQTYSEAGLKQSKLWEKDTLCMTIAANIAETALLSFPACFPDSIVGFVADEKKSNVKYVKYALDLAKKNFQKTSKGTAQDNLSLSKIDTLKISVPDVVTQTRIASVLSAYDDLIENNEKRIKALEEMAQLLYTEWFVKFKFPGHEKVKMAESGTEYGMVPEGWEVKRLCEVVDNLRTSAQTGENLKGRQYVPIENISKKSFIIRESNSWMKAQSSLILFEKKDILFGAMRPYFHKVAIASNPGVTRSTCLVLRPKKDFLLSFSLLTVFSNNFVDFASSNTQGATIPYAVWKNSLENYKILVPTDKSLIEFETIIEKLIHQISLLVEKNNTLSKTRDLLIPQLVTGKRTLK